VGIYNFEPLAAVDENGQAEGLFIDVLNHIAQKESWAITYVPGSWNQCLERLKRNDIDLLSSAVYSEQRAQFFDFTNEFLFLDWGLVYKKKGSPIQTIFDLDGKRVSALKRSVYTTGFKSLLYQFGIKATLIELDEYTQVFEAIKTGRTDCGINGQVYGMHIEGDYPVERTEILFAPSKIRFAVHKGRHPDILKTLDRHFAQLKSDQGSMYHKAFDRWVGLYANKQKTSPLLFWSLVGVAVLSLIFIFFSLLLKREVGRKTTELLAANESMAASEERFRSTFEQAAVGMAHLSLDGKWLRVNQRLCDILGRTCDYLQSCTYMQIIQPDLSEQIDHIQQLLDDGIEQHCFEKHLIPIDRPELWIYATVSLVRNTSGDPDYFTVVIEDITERKLAEAEKERLLWAIEQSGEIVAITDYEGAIEYVNPAFERVTGYTSKEAVGWNPNILSNGPHDPDFYNNLQNTIVTGKQWSGRLLNRRKDGGLYTTECSISPVKDDADRIIHFIWIARDISKSLELEKRAAQSQRLEAIGALAGGIAHDFNNLLFPIFGLSELLLEDLPQNSQEHGQVAEIFKAAQRAGDLVKQILSFSRQTDQEKVPVKIQSVLMEAIQLLRATIPANIEIRQSIQKECRLVMADPTNLHQIVVNLVTNAYHAVENNSGHIAIELHEVQLGEEDVAGTNLSPGHYARLTVSDTGYGISPENISRIFEPYFTTKKQGKGTGLGLSVVYGIVKEHNGDIRIYSELGKGTTINVYLPLLTTCEAQPVIEQPDAYAVGSGHILLVDDEQAIVRLVNTMLERMGYQVQGCTDSAKALQLFKADPDGFDLLITDMTMPKMTGLQLAESVMAIKPDMPIILCTGFSEKLTPEKVRALGIKGFIMKPVVRSELARTIRTILDKTDEERD